MSEYKLKPGKLGKKIMDAYQGIEDKFVDKFLEEDGSLKTGGMAEKATAAYHKVEDTVVGGYKKVENAFVDTFLEKVDEPEAKDSEEKNNAKQRTAGTAQMCLLFSFIFKITDNTKNGSDNLDRAIKNSSELR